METTKLIVSPNFKKISNGEKALIYDAKTGKGLKLDAGALKVVEMFSQGISEKEIKQKFNAPELDALLENLMQKKLILSNKEQAPTPDFSITEEKLKGSIVRHLRLNVTEKCNLDCSYCFERESNVYTKRRVMDWEVAKKAIDEFISLVSDHKQERVDIRFFGGEPLLNWKLVKQCLDYSREKMPSNIKVAYLLNTNGTLINEEIAKTLHQFGVHTALSIDGVGEYHDKARMYKNGQGSFAVIDRNIDLLIENQCEFGCAVVCADHNLPHLNKLIDYLKKKQDETKHRMNVNFSLVKMVKEDENSLSVEKKVDYLLNAVKYAQENDVRCNGGLTHFVFRRLIRGSVGSFCAGIGGEVSVDPEGNIFSCCSLEAKLGTLDNLRAVFKTKEYSELLSRRPGNIRQCKGCEIEGLCAGGCLADVVWSSGGIHGDYPSCEQQKLVFRKLVEEYLEG